MKGEKLKEKVEKIGIPFRQIADLMGISEQNLQNKFKVDDVKTSFICELANKLNKSIYFFLDDDLIVKEKDEKLNDNANKQCETYVPYKLYSELKEENNDLHDKIINQAELIGQLKAKVEIVREDTKPYRITAVSESHSGYHNIVSNKKNK